MDGPRVAILITPWLGSAAPFFNLEIALMLAGAGRRVSLLWDSTDLIGNAPNAKDTAAIASTFRDLPPWFEIIDVGAHPVSADAVPHLDDDWIEAMLFENGVWRMRGEGSAGSYVGRKRAEIPRIREHVLRVQDILAKGDWSWLLIPGGVWGLSGIYVALVDRVGRAYTTYDCSVNYLTTCQNGLACHHADIASAVDLVRRKMTPEHQDYLRHRASTELQERVAGRGNQATFQTRPAGQASGDFNVLVPLNLRWDSAALGRNRLFANVEDWIVGLLRWVESEPTARLCFRQHPVERDIATRGSDDIAALVERENRAKTRVRFVAADEDVNTYELLKTIRVVSPYTSSVGVEAGMLGIPVIVSALNYYDHASFVHHPESQQEYFALLSRAIRGDLAVPDGGVSEAALFYHLVQECNIMPTCFTPAPSDFLDWVKISPEELWEQPAGADLRQALLSGQPLSYLVSRRILAAANLSS